PAPMTATRTVTAATTKTRRREASWSRQIFSHARSRSPDDADAGGVGGLDDRVAVDHERLAGIDGQHRRAGGLHRVDRRDADDRHVEPHVLIWLRDLDDAD